MDPNETPDVRKQSWQYAAKAVALMSLLDLSPSKALALLLWHLDLMGVDVGPDSALPAMIEIRIREQLTRKGLDFV